MSKARTITRERVEDFLDLLRTGAQPADPKDLVDLIAGLEDVKSAACAVQAEAAVAFDAARRAEQAATGVPAHRQGRGIANEIALARKEAPARGQVVLGLAKVLHAEMPHTLARLRDGSLNEFRATLIARETACLEVATDEAVCSDPTDSRASAPASSSAGSSAWPPSSTPPHSPSAPDRPRPTGPSPCAQRPTR